MIRPAVYGDSGDFIPFNTISHKALHIMASSREVRVYKGSCHCTATKFSVKAPTIVSASSCNCSICSKNGSLFIYPTPKDFVFELEGPLTEYRFGKKTLGHKVSLQDFAMKLCLPFTSESAQLRALSSAQCAAACSW
jgi:hypothetical protein